MAISSKQRNGNKEIFELTISQLIEEYRAMNIEGGKFAMTAVQFNLSEEQRKDLEEKLNEFKEYQKELAFEFISRFLK